MDTSPLLIRCSASTKDKFKLLSAGLKIKYEDLLDRLLQEYEVKIEITKK